MAVVDRDRARTQGRETGCGAGARPGTLDALVKYQQLVTGGSPVSSILDWDTFGGKLYVVAKLADNSIRHFYDGTMVPDWTSPAPIPPGFSSASQQAKSS